MANREDVRLLQDAIQHTGSVFNQQREQQDRSRETMQRLALESQIKDVQEKRYGAQEAHFNEMESLGARKQNTDAATKQKELVSKIVGDTIKNYSGYVKDGLMDAGVATDLVKSSFQKLPPEAQQALSDNPEYSSVMDDNFQFKAPPGKPDVRDDNLVARSKYADSLRQQAAQLRQSGDTAGAGALEMRADHLEKSIGGADPTALQTVTTTTKGEPEVQADITPASSGFGIRDFRFGAHPAITNTPAIAAIPAVTTSRKVPVGGFSSQPTDVTSTNSITKPVPSGGGLSIQTNTVPDGTSPFKEGTTVRNNKTGQRGRVINGQFVPNGQ